MKRAILMSLAAVVCFVIAFPAAAKIADNQKDQLSYSIGVQTGKAFKNHKVNLNPKVFAEGLADAMNGKPYQMSQQQMNVRLAAFRQESLAKLQKQVEYVATKNAKKGAAFLAANQHKSGVKTTASGLQYKILKKGSGQSPALNDMVTVNYEGSLISGKVFDSSFKRGKPVTFPVANVIQGWKEALMLMKPGAVWKLYIPSRLAYGKRGVPGAIGPNEVLIFKVQLISVQKQPSKNQ